MPVTARFVAFPPAIVAGNTAIGVKQITKTTLKVMNRSRVFCPVRTGNLRNAHHMDVRVGFQMVYGDVYNKVKYARAVHQGVGARTIRPVTAQALAFWWKGRHWILKSVHQKARKGRPWMRLALAEVASQDGYKLTRAARYTFPAHH